MGVSLLINLLIMSVEDTGGTNEEGHINENVLM